VDVYVYPDLCHFYLRVQCYKVLALYKELSIDHATSLFCNLTKLYNFLYRRALQLYQISKVPSISLFFNMPINPVQLTVFSCIMYGPRSFFFKLLRFLFYSTPPFIYSTVLPLLLYNTVHYRIVQYTPSLRTC